MLLLSISRPVTITCFARGDTLSRSLTTRSPRRILLSAPFSGSTRAALASLNQISSFIHTLRCCHRCYVLYCVSPVIAPWNVLRFCRDGACADKESLNTELPVSWHRSAERFPGISEHLRYYFQTSALLLYLKGCGTLNTFF